MKNDQIKLVLLTLKKQLKVDKCKFLIYRHENNVYKTYYEDSEKYAEIEQSFMLKTAIRNIKKLLKENYEISEFDKCEMNIDFINMEIADLTVYFKKTTNGIERKLKKHL